MWLRAGLSERGRLPECGPDQDRGETGLSAFVYPSTLSVIPLRFELIVWFGPSSI